MNETNAQWTPVPAPFGLCGEQGSETSWGLACVIDGDTLYIRRAAAQPRRIRITGYDAPELDGPCEAERRKAAEARRALHTWLEAGDAQWDGGTDPPFDQYGRELRSLRRMSAKGGYETLAHHMLAAGLGANSDWGSAPKGWCA